MAKEKQYVFSARTTEDGLKALNQLKDRLKIGWDEFVIAGMSGHYKLDKRSSLWPRNRRPRASRRKSRPAR